MARTRFENLRVYLLAEEIADLKALIQPLEKNTRPLESSNPRILYTNLLEERQQPTNNKRQT